METDTAIPLHSTKLLDRVKEAIRQKHYSASTEQAYVYWCRSYIRFHQLRHPKDIGTEEIDTLISHLSDMHLLLAKLLYGTGVRLNDAQFAIQRFRFSESDYYRERENKGKKDRSLMLPVSLLDLLNAQLAFANSIWAKDRAGNVAAVALSWNIARLYPTVGQSWPWY